MILADPLVVDLVHVELDRVERVLLRAADNVQAQDALAVIREARLELCMERPDKLRLRRLLGGLARNVTAMDGLKMAGELLGRLVRML